MMIRGYRYNLLILAGLLFLTGSLSASTSETEQKKMVCTAVKTFYQNHLKLTGQELSIEYPKLETIVLAEGYTRVEVRPSRNRIKAGIQILQIALYNGELMLKQVPLKVRVRTYQNVLVCPARLNRHHTLTEADLVFERRETSATRKQFFVNKHEVLGLRTTRLLQQGEILYAEAIETVPLIKRGENVEIRFQKGHIEIGMPGVARQDGRLGDQIQVKCTDTKKLFKGLVQDSETVIVNL